MAAKTGEWRMVSERSLLRTRVFEVCEERWERPDNAFAGDFYTLKCGDWVNVVAVTADAELVMIRQFRPGNRQVELEIPGGLIDPGETPLEAGVRELREETGYHGGSAELIGAVCPNPAFHRNRCHTVLVTGAVAGEATSDDPGEDIETFLAPLASLKTMIRSGRITHGLVLNALHFLDLKLES